MCKEIIFEDGEVRHRCIDHRRERIIAVFCNDDIAAPGYLFFKVPSLNVTDTFVDGELHAVPRNSGIEDDVRVGELLVHAVQGFDELIRSRSARSGVFERDRHT